MTNKTRNQPTANHKQKPSRIKLEVIKTEEKLRCFGVYGNPLAALVKNKDCSICTTATACQQQLIKHIESHIKIIKQTPKTAIIDFDIFNVGYIMKPSTADMIGKLYLENANEKSHYNMGRETNGTFYIPKENAERFISRLKEILTNIDNLDPLEFGWEQCQKNHARKSN